MKMRRSKKREWLSVSHLATTHMRFAIIAGAHRSHESHPGTWRFVVAPMAVYAANHLVRWKSESTCNLVMWRSCVMPGGANALYLTLSTFFFACHGAVRRCQFAVDWKEITASLCNYSRRK